MKHIDKCDPCSKSEMDFHSMPHMITSISDSMIVAYPPISALDLDATLVKYNIPGSSDAYIDLSNSYHYIKGRIKTGTGGDLGAGSKAAPVCGFPYAIFSSFELSLNGKQVTQPNAHHSYIPYFHFLFNYSKEAKDSQLRGIVWAKDTARHFDKADDPAAEKNEGWATRQAICAGSVEFEMYAPVISDVCNQPKLIINGVDINFVFHRSRSSFCIMNPVATPEETKFVITDCALFIRRVKPSPTTLIEDERALDKGPCLYPLIKTDIRLHTIATGLISKEIPSVTTGRIPNRIIIGLTENAGLVGSYKINPWNFSHHNVRSISLTIGGRQYPSKLFNLSYSTNIYMRAYMQMFEGLGIQYGDAGIDISYEDFPNGYCLYIFDLTASQIANCGESVIEAARETDVNIQIEFAVAPTKALSCVVYTESPALMEINKDRNVYLEYTN